MYAGCIHTMGLTAPDSAVLEVIDTVLLADGFVLVCS